MRSDGGNARRWAWAWGLFAGAGLGCGGPTTAEPDPEAAGSGTSTGAVTTSGSTGAPVGSDDDGGSSSSGAEVLLDLPPPVEMTCSKIDFLFVIDNSGSMTDEQARLIDGFPGFIAGIEESIAQYDYHLMVVTVDATPTGSKTDPCDGEFGAGRIVASDSTPCALPKGQRFADTETEDLTALFACLADVGTEGSGSEMPIWGMAQAVTEQNLPGRCNEGFLRDDAILVVTIITDEEDDEGVDSPAGPAVWRDVMVSAKHGDENAIVMLGLVGDTDLPDAVCQPFDFMGGGAQGAPRLREFVESFPRGSWASVCLDDFAPFFNDAVIDVGEACEEFVPPG